MPCLLHHLLRTTSLAAYHKTRGGEQVFHFDTASATVILRMIERTNERLRGGRVGGGGGLRGVTCVDSPMILHGATVCALGTW